MTLRHVTQYLPMTAPAAKPEPKAPASNPISGKTHRKPEKTPIKLTCSPLAATIPTAGSSQHGCGSSFSLGEKPPQSLAAFLCTSLFSAAFSRLFIMAGCFGQRSALTVLPSSSFPLHFSPSPDTVESIGGGYFPLLGVTA